MTDHFLTRAKAYAALAGAVITALINQYGPTGNVGALLTLLSVVATAVAAYSVPNKRKAVK